MNLRRLAVPLICAPILAGCAGPFAGGVESMYADPGKYDYYDCSQLAGQLPALTSRETDLRELIARARRGIGGSLVVATTYQPELDSVRADMALVRQAQQAKQCGAADKGSATERRAVPR